jgi:hypothetical protein
VLGTPVTFRQLKTSSGPFRVGSYTAGSIIADADEIIRHEGEAAYSRLTGYVLARHLVGDQQLLEVRHPATWWQHLKLSLPGRVRKRWPVRYCVTRAKASFAKYDAYPGADLPLPSEFGTPVQYDTLSWSGPDGGQGDPCNSSCSPSVRSTPVNDGRRFLGRDELIRELAVFLNREVMAISPGEGIGPMFAIQEAVKVLERLGVNTGQLVQQHAIDEAHRTW